MSNPALEVRIVHSVPETRQLIFKGWEIVAGVRTHDGVQILMRHTILLIRVNAEAYTLCWTMRIMLRKNRQKKVKLRMMLDRCWIRVVFDPFFIWQWKTRRYGLQ